MKPRSVEVVALIGSSRFKEAFESVGQYLEKNGMLALAMTFFQHADGIPVTDEERRMLEVVDDKRLSLADRVIVINVLRPRCPVCRSWHVEHFTRAGYQHTPTCQCDVNVPGNSAFKAFERYFYLGPSTKRELSNALALKLPVANLFETCNMPTSFLKHFVHPKDPEKYIVVQSYCDRGDPFPPGNMRVELYPLPKGFSTYAGQPFMRVDHAWKKAHELAKELGFKQTHEGKSAEVSYQDWAWSTFRLRW